MVDAGERAKVYSTLDARFQEFVDLLSEYARVPTISAHGTKFQEGADATKTVVEAAGAEVRLWPEEGEPPTGPRAPDSGAGAVGAP